MIKFEDYAILSNNISTLKETSIDNRDKGYAAYMTNSDRAAVNFDDVKREYIRTLNLSEEPKSNDALFLTDNNDNKKPYWVLKIRIVPVRFLIHTAVLSF